MNNDSDIIEGQVVEARGAANLPSTIQHANPYPAMIEKIIDRGGDLANLDKMLDLQIKWEANEARKAFVAAMAAFKAEPMEILKRKLVEFETNTGTTSYTHAELSDVTDVVVPAMGKHGLSHRWDVQQEGGQITVTCMITHELGHSESVSMTAAPDASGKKNAIQQVASAVTYLQRYTLLSATGMATKGMDDDGRSFVQAEAEPHPDQAWIDALEECADVDSLRARKAEMVEKFPNGVPRHLIGTYNRRLAELDKVPA